MHKFIDFKNFATASLNLFRPVTVLIGKNGAGKTNSIEAVELLAILAQGRPLYEISDVGRATANGFEIRGGISACPREGTEQFELSFTGNIHFQGASQPFEYSVRITTTPEPGIYHEHLRVGQRVIFNADRDINAAHFMLRVTFDNFARGGNKPSFSCPFDRTAISQYRAQTVDYLARNPAFKQTHALVGSLMTYMQSSYAFDPNPKAMRAYERMGQKSLTRNGSNISSVLHALKSGTTEQQDTIRRIASLITQLPEEPFADFGFAETSQSDVLMGLTRQSGAALMDARVLSDGTLRSLAVLTALETVPPQSRIVIEEFDNGVHPSRVGMLTTAIWECSKRRRLNTLVTTHNPATLDALSEEQMRSVVLCFRNPGDSSSQLRELVSLPKSDVLLTQGHLGDLITRKVLEKYLLPNFEQDQKKIAEDWLATLA